MEDELVFMDADLDKKKKLLEEISDLTHIGRSAGEIEQSLSAMGYDKVMLSETLTPLFMKSLIEKEERFVLMQESANKLAVDKAEKEDSENLSLKRMEQQAQEQKMKEEAIRQDEEQIQSTEAEKKRIGLDEQGTREEYLMKADEEQKDARNQAEMQNARTAFKKQEQEEEMRLRDFVLQ